MKEIIKGTLGKYVQLEFTITSKKHKTTQYFNLYGFVTKIENRNILFKDNHNHEFIVPIDRITQCLVEKNRRKPKKQ